MFLLLNNFCYKSEQRLESKTSQESSSYVIATYGKLDTIDLCSPLGYNPETGETVSLFKNM